jgi:hypothetical protein
MVPPVANRTPHFFTTAEMTSITLMSDLIIQLTTIPGRKGCRCSAFIDLMVSESSVRRKPLAQGRRNRSARVNSVTFATLTSEQQVAVLKLISRNEYQPRKLEGVFHRD